MPINSEFASHLNHFLLSKTDLLIQARLMKRTIMPKIDAGYEFSYAET